MVFVTGSILKRDESVKVSSSTFRSGAIASMLLALILSKQPRYMCMHACCDIWATRLHAYMCIQCIHVHVVQYTYRAYHQLIQVLAACSFSTTPLAQALVTTQI